MSDSDQIDELFRRHQGADMQDLFDDCGMSDVAVAVVITVVSVVLVVITVGMLL